MRREEADVEALESHVYDAYVPGFFDGELPAPTTLALDIRLGAFIKM
jgi:hypothetical protein